MAELHDNTRPREPRNEALPRTTYTRLLRSIQRDPYADDVWSRTVELAQSEETAGGGSESFYSHVPLNELITVGQRLRSTSRQGTVLK